MSSIASKSGRILSGVQPTGNLHLGNYLGAIRNWVKLQNDYECLFMLADLHAITVPQDPEKLRAHVRETAAAYIACGVNPEKSAIFHQSAVSAHAELAWILSCHTPLGWLNRMTQFKEKIQSVKEDMRGLIKLVGESIGLVEEWGKLLNEKLDLLDDSTNFLTELTEKKEELGKRLETTASEDIQTQLQLFLKKIEGYIDNTKIRISKNNLRESVSNLEEVTSLLRSIFDILSDHLSATERANLGLYSYPVLMAADILAYKATHVPVGEDQKQHLELARDIAGAFNRNYDKDLFPLPSPVIMGSAARIMSLRDGTKKMSKSDESDYSRINLTDDADMIVKKIKKAKSDMVEGDITFADDRPEAKNLLTIYAALKDITKEQALVEVAGMNFSSFKTLLADVAVAHLAPISQKMRELLAEPDYLDSILVRGVTKANKLAEDTMKNVKDTVGFLRL